MELTIEQRRVYDWIVNFIKEKEYSPAIDEIREGLNYKSPCAVQKLLCHLQNKKFIDWSDNKARTIKIIPNAYFDACADGCK
jgi:repressor LexA